MVDEATGDDKTIFHDYSAFLRHRLRVMVHVLDAPSALSSSCTMYVYFNCVNLDCDAICQYSLSAVHLFRYFLRRAVVVSNQVNIRQGEHQTKLWQVQGNTPCTRGTRTFIFYWKFCCRQHHFATTLTALAFQQ